MRNSFLVRAFAAALLALGLAGTSVAQQAVRVGSTPTGVPFTFLDTKTNQISGIMVDLMKAIGKDQGFAIEITPMTFSTLIAALQANKIDVIAAAMYITPTRQEVVDFSDPIITYGEGLFVAAKDTKDYTSMADLKGEIVGVQIGTAYVKPLTDSGLFKEIKVYDTIPDIIRDVNLGRIKARLRRLPDRRLPALARRLSRDAAGQELQAGAARQRGHRREEGRQGHARQDQRVAAQDEGRRLHRQDPRPVGAQVSRRGRAS